MSAVGILTRAAVARPQEQAKAEEAQGGRVRLNDRSAAPFGIMSEPALEFGSRRERILGHKRRRVRRLAIVGLSLSPLDAELRSLLLSAVDAGRRTIDEVDIVDLAPDWSRAV